MSLSRSHPAAPVAVQLRPGEFFVPLGSATLAPGSSADLGHTFGPDNNTHPPSAAEPSASPPPVTYSATPDDGTPDGDKLALMNDLMRAVPGGATTVLWFDERPPEVQHHDLATLADDLVTLTGGPPSTPALASVVASAIKKED